MRRATLPLAVLILTALSTTAQGGFLLQQPTGPPNLILSQSYSYNGGIIESNLDPGTSNYLPSATSTLQGPLQQDFPGWTINYNQNGLSGTMTINTYQAILSGTGNSGGATLNATYTVGASDPPIANLRWIQVVATNDPLGGQTSPYLDDSANFGATPFYDTVPESQINKDQFTYEFNDQAARPTPGPGGSTYWDAQLYLASWDGMTGITVFDGFTWGYLLSNITTDRPFQIRAFDAPVAVPEPGSFGLALVGIVAVGLKAARARTGRR